MHDAAGHTLARARIEDGCQVQVARYRERRNVSGTEGDTTDAHALADMVPTDGHRLPTGRRDSEQA